MRLRSPLQASVDGSFWVFFNEDKTRAILVVAPPQGDGNPVRVDQVVHALEEMGVAYGIDRQAIHEIIARATRIADKAQGVVAEGVPPVHGTDAKIHYRVPEEVINRPLPLLPDGSVDYLQIDKARFVEAGQLIATIVPAQPGRPGRTLTFPPQTVPHRPGREANLRAGEHIITSEDNLHLSAECSGFAYVKGDRLSVLPAKPVESDLQGEVEFESSLVLWGRLLTGSRIRVRGDAAISGRCEGAYLRTRGTCHLRSGATESEIAAEGNILLDGKAVDCRLTTRQQIIALHSDAEIVGGRVVAFQGVDAYNIGDSSWSPTEVIVGVDVLGEERLFEIAQEIRQCEDNIQKISEALRPFASVTMETASPEKKEALQRLMTHRRRLELHVKDLEHEKRAITIQVNSPTKAEVVVRGTVYPGVKITIGKYSYLVETNMQAVRFFVARGEARVQVRSLHTS